MNFGNEAEVSKASAQIWQSRAGMKSTVEWMVPARRALPTLEAPPVSPVNPALAATRVRLATVAARYNWIFGFWHGRSSGTGGFPAGPAAPTGAPPPPGAAGTRQRPRSAAGRGPAVTALPAGAVAPFVPYPVLPPRTGAAAGTPRRPLHRTGSPSVDEFDRWDRSESRKAVSSG